MSRTGTTHPGLLRLAVLLVVASLAAACAGPPVPTLPATPLPSSPPVATGDALALEACDPAGYLGCDQQAAFLSIPIVDTGLALTWSSQWAPARKDRPGWDATGLGLGGWSIDAIQRYLPTGRALIGGDGSWRIADPVHLDSGESAVPSFDGSLAYVFDAAGREVRTVDGHLGTTLLSFTYDAAGRLSGVDGTVGGRPAHMAVQRAADGTPRALLGIDGSMTLLDVTDGRLVAVHAPGGSTTRLGSTAGGLVTSETDPLGGVTRFVYDADGRLASATDADGVVTAWTRTDLAAGHETRVSTGGGVTIYRTERSGGGVRRTVTAADGTSTVETTSVQGSRTIAYADGTTVSIGEAPSTAWAMSAPLLTPVVASRPDGVTSHTEVTEQLSEVGGSPFRTSGTVTRTINGAAWTLAFDPAGRTEVLTDPEGRRTTELFDGSGRLNGWSGPGSAPLTVTYDARGRAASETSGTGALARTTSFAWDPSIGSVVVTRPDRSTTTLTVDANGQPAATTAADGSTVLEVSDADGRLSRVQPAGGLAYTLGSSPAGRPTAFLPPPTAGDASIEITRDDAAGRPVAISGPGTRSIAMTYDASGRLAGWTFDRGTGSASYNPTSGLLARAVDPGGISTSYGYAGGTLDTIAWSGALTGSVGVTLDANGRAVAETVDGSASLSRAYDGSGALTGIGGLSLSRDPASGLVTRSTLGVVSTDQLYDSSDRLVRTTTSAAGTILQDLQLRYDDLGRIAAVAGLGPGGALHTTAYAYDAADRLAVVTVDGHPVETDTYDPAGDRTAIATPSGTATATYDVRDRLLAVGATTCSWAPDGSLAARTDPNGRTTFAYDDLGGLRSAALPSGRTVTYLVDAAGRRVGRAVDGALVEGYLYDPAGHVVALTDGSGAVVARFGYDDLGHLALMERGGTSYRIVTDPVGSPGIVVDATSGAVADAITYDAWGRVTSETAPGLLPFGFAGGLRDADTGLVHLGARDYDPVSGRWTSPDPLRFVAGDANLYRYASDDPVNRADPSGLDGGGGSLLMGGVSFTFSGIAGYGPTGSVTFQWIEGAGPNFYLSGGGGVGGDIGFSVTPNIGVIRNPSADPARDIEGATNGANLGRGPATIGIYGSPASADPNAPRYAGIQAGPSLGPIPFVSASGTRTYSTCVTCSWGETHLVTSNGSHVDFQAAGEFLALRSSDGTVVVEARQQAIDGLTAVAFNTAVAAGVAGDRVGVYAREPSFLIVNGQPVTAVDLQEQLPHGGTLERHGGVVAIGWPDGSRLVVTDVLDTLEYGFLPGPGVGPALSGLLGADGNPAGDLAARDGTVLALSDPAFATGLYRQVGDSWRLGPGESLFDYRPGESSATFTDLSIPSSAATVDTLPPATRSSAEAICRAVGVEARPLLDDCTLDVGVTGNPGYASAAAAIAAAGTPATPVAATPVPPSSPPAAPSVSSSPGIPASSPGPLILGRPVTGTIAAAGQRDAWTFTVSAGAIVYLQALPPCVQGLEWHLEVPGGGAFTYNDTCHDIGRQVLSTPGTWTISVTSPSGATGPYAFTAWPVPATTSTGLVLGQPVSGSVETVGAWHDYAFAGTAGEVLTLRSAWSAARGTCPDGLDWALIRPDGGTQAYGPTCDDIGRQVLSTGGTWLVRISPEAAATGAYSVVVQAGS